MNATGTYVALNREGIEIARGSLREVCDAVMSDDGHDWEIRRDADNCHVLFVTQFSRNSTLGGLPMTASIFYSAADDDATAEAEILDKVVRRADVFRGACILTVEQFLASMAAE